MTSTNLWTSEKTDQLKAWWSEGFTASQIARMFGPPITRSSICAKVRRLNLERGGSAGGRPPRRHLPGDIQVVPRRAPPSAMAEEPKPTLAADGSKLTVLSITAHACRWPHGDPLSPDFHFCGAKQIPESPYCEFHSRKAWASGKVAA